MKYKFSVPPKRQVRVIIHTDCKNEADDQFAVVHQLLTPRFVVKGIIGAHFERGAGMMWDVEKGKTASESYNEVLKVLGYMGERDQYTVVKGAELPLENEQTPQISDGAKMIIDEAMKDDDRPLFINCQGSLTDLASAILMKPEICKRMTAIWIGGQSYPKGGEEFNLMMDPLAANVVFSSEMPLWQVPMQVYKTFSVSLAELEYKVEPCGEIGKYLFENMVKLNERLGDTGYLWPQGEIWGLGDQGCVAALMQEEERNDNYHTEKAPRVNLQTLQYEKGGSEKEIRVYDSLDCRLTLEDFFAKLALNYGK